MTTPEPTDDAMPPGFTGGVHDLAQARRAIFRLNQRCDQLADQHDAANSRLQTLRDALDSVGVYVIDDDTNADIAANLRDWQAKAQTEAPAPPLADEQAPDGAEEATGRGEAVEAPQGFPLSGFVLYAGSEPLTDFELAERAPGWERLMAGEESA